jgi:hypothetical protein
MAGLVPATQKRGVGRWAGQQPADNDDAPRFWVAGTSPAMMI